MFRMDAVMTAADKRYVLMNAPKECVEQIVAVLPGVKSPTIMPRLRRAGAVFIPCWMSSAFGILSAASRRPGLKVFWCCPLKR